VPKKKSSEEAHAEIRSKGFEPLEEYPGSSSPWRVKCLTCGEVTTPRLSNLIHKSSTCKYCAGRAVTEKSAVAFMISRGVKPLEPYRGNKVPWKCECLNCGSIVTPKFNNAQTQNPCRICSMKILTKSRISVAEEDAIALMKERSLFPLEPYPGSHKNWKCQCMKCGAIVTPKANWIQQGDGGCKYCAPNYLDPKEAVRNMVNYGYQPLSDFVGTKDKWKCIHLLCGREVVIRYNSISTGQGGCRYCAKYGFNYNDPAYLYLITNAELHAHKIGIATIGKGRGDRVKSHQKHGWELVKRLDFEIAEEAFNLEQRVLAWLRLEKQLPPYLTKNEMPQRGETETVGSDSISLGELWAKVLELDKLLSTRRHQGR